MAIPHMTSTSLFHSMHNMGKGKNNVLLVNLDLHDRAIKILGTIHEVLYADIPQPYHSPVFLNGRVRLSSRQNDTILACNYSSYANELLSCSPSSGITIEELDIRMHQSR
jgi:hypothetical protein